MRDATRRLLDDFDAIEADHGEVYETDVRESIGMCLRHALFVPQPGYRIPPEFQMMSAEGNALVVAALTRFLSHPDTVALAQSPLSPADRLAAFQDPSLEKGSLLVFGKGVTSRFPQFRMRAIFGKRAASRFPQFQHASNCSPAAFCTFALSMRLRRLARTQCGHLRRAGTGKGAYRKRGHFGSVENLIELA